MVWSWLCTQFHGNFQPVELMLDESALEAPPPPSMCLPETEVIPVWGKHGLLQFSHSWEGWSSRTKSPACFSLWGLVRSRQDAFNAAPSSELLVPESQVDRTVGAKPPPHFLFQALPKHGGLITSPLLISQCPGAAQQRPLSTSHTGDPEEPAEST